MSAEDFDPDHVANCGMCEYALHRREAELGLRCRDCLAVFGSRPWIHPSEADASRCPGCQAKAEWRATDPQRGAGMYGSAGPA